MLISVFANIQIINEINKRTEINPCVFIEK